MIGTREKDLLDRIDRLASSGMTDPASAAQTLREISQTVSPLKERLTRPVSPTRIYTVPFAGQSVVVANTGIVTIPPVVMTWPKLGRVIGVKALCVQGMDLATHLTLQIQDQSTYSFFQNGAGPAPVTFAALTGNVWELASYFPFLDRDVAPSEQWTITVGTLDPEPTIVSSNTYTPEVTFLFEDK